MTSIQPRFTNGPRTYTAGEAIDGGQLVEARAGSVIGVAGAGSLKVLGVAQKAASPTGNAVRTADATGYVDMTLGAPPEVAVINDGFVPVKFAAAAAFGDRLIAAAAGTVTPAGATPDARTIVGFCAELAGVALNGTGLMRVNV
jgi:hypothetical protein